MKAGKSTYTILGLRFGVRHKKQPACLVVSLLAGQVERRKLGLLWMLVEGKRFVSISFGGLDREKRVIIGVDLTASSAVSTMCVVWSRLLRALACVVGR